MDGNYLIGMFSYLFHPLNFLGLPKLFLSFSAITLSRALQSHLVQVSTVWLQPAWKIQENAKQNIIVLSHCVITWTAGQIRNFQQSIWQFWAVVQWARILYISAHHRKKVIGLAYQMIWDHLLNIQKMMKYNNYKGKRFFVWSSFLPNTQ